MYRPHAARRTTALTLSLATVLGLTAATTATPRSGDPHTTAAAPVPKLDWKPCGKGELSDFQCATTEVPTDYDRPRGATTTIALTRLPASDPGKRIGSLFTNPGGPGGSGVDFVHHAGKVAYDPAVRARFDIIGFDPRGVGDSDPVTCFASAEEEKAALARIPVFPFTEKQEKPFLRRLLEVPKACMKRSRERIEHASTANVARDMDLLRRAVGDKKLTYAGYSYGTFLGATYAKLFPDNVRALMLDGAVEPTGYTGVNGDTRSVVTRTGQGEAAGRALGEFLRLCAKAGPDRCALARPGDPRAVMERTLRRLKTRPVTVHLPEGPPVEVTYPFAVETLYNGLYTPRSWPVLAEAFAAVATAGKRLDRPTAAVGGYFRTLRDKEFASKGEVLANLCVDTLNPKSPKSFPAEADAEDAKSLHFGRYRTWQGLSCTVIGNADRDAHLGGWRQRVDAPVMVVGTRFDPATPYEKTRPFADKFPDARMATLEGWGHGGTLLQSTCMNRLVARYLVELEATDGATCKPDTQPFAAPTPTGGGPVGTGTREAP
ncbi:alpha/beta hydrolase [Streptomyces sp. A1499]|uniref:alpha/beta hydrolase n=1 Tax=Streptomyces sp. A1499 TaxID=2563104 RepID=UPI00109E5A0A|nr:alpha/beta hydrolase [Streptomyces sp. A1499]THC51767.1 alpha/beta hydrolase [Streptomyces sp. A1499]